MKSSNDSGDRQLVPICRHCGFPKGKHRAGDYLCPFRLLNGEVSADPWRWRRGLRTFYEDRTYRRRVRL